MSISTSKNITFSQPILNNVDFPMVNQGIFWVPSSKIGLKLLQFQDLLKI